MRTGGGGAPLLCSCGPSLSALWQPRCCSLGSREATFCHLLSFHWSKAFKMLPSSSVPLHLLSSLRPLAPCLYSASCHAPHRSQGLWPRTQSQPLDSLGKPFPPAPLPYRRQSGPLGAATASPVLLPAHLSNLCPSSPPPHTPTADSGPHSSAWNRGATLWGTLLLQPA